MKKKCCIIDPVGSHGGFDVFTLNLAKEIQKKGWDITLYTSDTEFAPHTIPTKKFFKHVFNKQRPLLSKILYLKGILFSLFHARFHGIKIVHYHFFEYRLPEFLMVFLAKLLCFKIVLSIHDLESFDNKENDYFSSYCMRTSHKLIALSNFSYKKLLESYGDMAEKIHIAPHGDYLHLNDSMPTKEIARQGLPYDNAETVFLFFGQIKEVKGLDVFIQAAATIVEESPSCRFIIAGKTWRTSFSKYDDMIHALSLEEYFHKDIRFIPDTDLLTYFAASDYVVLPHRKIYQSGVLLLAMSLGKKVIVSDLPAMKEVVQNNVNGFTFKQNDSNDLAHTCLNALSSEIKIEYAAKKYVEDHHSWELVATKTHEIYMELI